MSDDTGFALVRYILFCLKAESIRKKLDELRQLLANKDNEPVSKIREAIGSLQQQSLKLFEAVYKKMAAEKSTQSTSGGTSFFSYLCAVSCTISSKAR